MKKMMDCIRECPLLLMIAVSALVLSGVAYVKVLLGDYKFNVTLGHPMLTSVLLDEEIATIGDATPNDATATDAISYLPEQTEEEKTERSDETTTEKPVKKDDKNKDGKDKENDKEKDNSKDKDNKDKNNKDKNNKDSKDNKDKTNQDTTEESTLGGGTAKTTEKAERPTQYTNIEKRKSRNDCYGDIDKIALTTDYPYEKVKGDYFKDALFIGDSRVEGLALYSGIDNADFAYMEGLTVDGMMTERIAEVDGSVMTLPELLSSKQYKKIYVMLGVNEVGYDTDYYVSNYIDKIHEIMDAQPGAIVFMMSCMYVSTDYSNKDDIINNDNIDDKNNGIASYANGINLFYLNVNTAVSDDNGGLKKEYTWDDIHLQAQYYKLWEDYLLEHGLNDNMWE